MKLLSRNQTIGALLIAAATASAAYVVTYGEREEVSVQTASEIQIETPPITAESVSAVELQVQNEPAEARLQIQEKAEPLSITRSEFQPKVEQLAELPRESVAESSQYSLVEDQHESPVERTQEVLNASLAIRDVDNASSKDVTSESAVPETPQELSQVSPVSSETPEPTYSVSQNEVRTERYGNEPAEPPVAQRQTNFTPQDESEQSFWVWAGSGVNMTSYSQSIPGISDVEYSVLKGPTLIVRGGSMATEHWGLDISYKSTPGEAASTSEIAVRNGDYDWQTITAEVLRCLWGCKKADESMFRVRAGIQHHEMPFMVPLSQGEIEIQNNTSTLASVGFDYTFMKQKRVSYELMMRYQHPFASSAQGSAQFDLSPQMAFDGSIGQVFKINSQWRLGIYWHGQLHKYKFNYQASPTSPAFAGNQSLFHSTVDLRLGFEF